ncbi:MAG: hypothetical protein IPJ49_15100 [Candidatus Obscuribacter sp.]|nr:hypothetical protein [Candidatus Obscuribacter sp.]
MPLSAQNQNDLAISNYEKYLTIEPSGTYNTNVRTAIEQIKNPGGTTTETAGGDKQTSL